MVCIEDAPPWGQLSQLGTHPHFQLLSGSLREALLGSILGSIWVSFGMHFGVDVGLILNMNLNMNGNIELPTRLAFNPLPPPAATSI